jgi:hypothetical protein
MEESMEEYDERIRELIGNIQEVLITHMIYNPEYAPKYEKITVEEFRNVINERTQMVLDNINEYGIEESIMKILQS